MSLQYVIDGYNIINHPLFERINKHTEDPRVVFLRYVRTQRLTGSPKNKVTIVFDGYPPTGEWPDEGGNIKIIFSRKINADERIKMLVEESANRKGITVVSDDKEIKFMAKSLGAVVVGAQEFISRKDKPKRYKDSALKPELTYSQMHKINQELRQIWLV